jgi:hypothetical protein
MRPLNRNNKRCLVTLAVSCIVLFTVPNTFSQVKSNSSNSPANTEKTEETEFLKNNKSGDLPSESVTKSTVSDNARFSISPSKTSDNNADDPIIFPNPAQGSLTIDPQTNCTISLITLDGKTLWTQTIEEKTTFILPETQGIYLLKIQTPEKTIIKKLVVN